MIEVPEPNARPLLWSVIESFDKKYRVGDPLVFLARIIDWDAMISAVRTNNSNNLDVSNTDMCKSICWIISLELVFGVRASKEFQDATKIDRKHHSIPPFFDFKALDVFHKVAADKKILDALTQELSSQLAAAGVFRQRNQVPIRALIISLLSVFFICSLLLASQLPWLSRYDFSVQLRRMLITLPGEQGYSLAPAQWLKIELDGSLSLPNQVVLWPITSPEFGGLKMLTDSTWPCGQIPTDGTAVEVDEGITFKSNSLSGTQSVTLVASPRNNVSGVVKTIGDEEFQLEVSAGSILQGSVTVGSLASRDKKLTGEIATGVSVVVLLSSEVAIEPQSALNASSFCISKQQPMLAKIAANEARFDLAWPATWRGDFSITNVRHSRIERVLGFDFDSRELGADGHETSSIQFGEIRPHFTDKEGWISLQRGDFLQFPAGITSGGISQIHINTTGLEPNLGLDGWFQTSEMAIGSSKAIYSTNALEMLKQNSIPVIILTSLIAFVSFVGSVTGILDWIRSRK